MVVGCADVDICVVGDSCAESRVDVDGCADVNGCVGVC